MGQDLDRWLAAEGRTRQVVCIGDSITVGVVDETTGRQGLSWVDLLAVELGASPGPELTDGFRGLWRSKEWRLEGSWTQTTRADPFDDAPFGYGFVGGEATDVATWTNVSGSTVDTFDLYTLAAPTTGPGQYRVDDGPWQDLGPSSVLAARADPVDASLASDPIDKGGQQIAALRMQVVEQPVLHRVQVRGTVAGEPRPVALAGIDVHRARRDDTPRTRVHHLGLGMQMLGSFSRESAGSPLALLDVIRPELIVVAFSNDVLWASPGIYEATLQGFVERVESYADVLVISPFEQRVPRRVHDAVTVAGSRHVSSATAVFVASDITVAVRGTNIAPDPPTFIVSVDSGSGTGTGSEAAMSAPATDDGTGGELVIGEGREVEAQAAYRAANQRVAAALGCRYLDVHDEWSRAGATGWDAATARGLMIDRYHASLEGHHDITARIVELLASGRPERSGGALGDPTGPPGEVPLPEIVPGTGRVAAPTSGVVELRVPVTLSTASTETVTVDWQTRLVDDIELPQATRSDYVAASGTVSFAPGETEASVPIAVTGHSTHGDACIVVAFSEPTNAVLTGTWGLGFGVIGSAHPEAG